MFVKETVADQMEGLERIQKLDCRNRQWVHMVDVGEREI